MLHIMCELHLELINVFFIVFSIIFNNLFTCYTLCVNCIWS